MELAKSCDRIIADGWDRQSLWRQETTRAPTCFLDVLKSQSSLFPALGSIDSEQQSARTKMVLSNEEEGSKQLGVPMFCIEGSEKVSVSSLCTSKHTWNDLCGRQSRTDEKQIVHNSRFHPSATDTIAIDVTTDEEGVHSTTEHKPEKLGANAAQGQESQLSPAPEGLASAAWSLDRFTDSSDEDDSYDSAPKRISIAIKPRESTLSSTSAGGPGQTLSVSAVLGAID